MFCYDSINRKFYSFVLQKMQRKEDDAHMSGKRQIPSKLDWPDTTKTTTQSTQIILRTSRFLRYFWLCFYII